MANITATTLAQKNNAVVLPAELGMFRKQSILRREILEPYRDDC